MIRLLTATLFAMLCLANTSFVAAQEKFARFGKVSEEELKMTECDFYPEATSMILAETGVLRFAYNNEKGWQYVMDVTVRKKIFKKTDKDIANIKITTYDPVVGSNREELSSIKGTTYNLVDGKIVKSKLTNSEEYGTRLSDYSYETSFALADVQEGSVIEYKYSLTSDYYSNLKTWQFQSDVPVAYSYFEYTIPEFFIYHTNQIGNYHPLTYENDIRSETFTYTWTSLPESGGKVESGKGTIPSISKKTAVTGENIPPLEDEPMMNNRVDLPTRITFQLATVQMPQSTIKNYAKTYQSFSEEIMTWNGFGLAMKRGGFAKDFIASNPNKDELRLTIDLYNWVMSNISWNEVYGFTSQNVGRVAMKEESGSVADINLALIAALREAGLEANPVILSTRGHGLPHPVYPNYEEFNYVIAHVVIDGRYYLCDATSRLPFGMLPIKCHNYNGWLVTENGGEWVSLKNGQHNSSITGQISFNEDEMRCSYEIKKEHHAALGVYQRIKKNGEEDYRAKLAEKFVEGEIENFQYNKSSKANQVYYNFDLVNDFLGDDMIYINPMRYGATTENQFKREKRFSPVDFPYQITEQILVTIEIPEGYRAELPPPSIVRMPNEAGSFLYNSSQIGNKITVLSKASIDKQDFSPEDYPGLKQFMELVAEKNNQMIILKKI
ncbi:MAG: DUF3858 domain-containing protein [Cyclobacteriaceae bacterium]